MDFIHINTINNMKILLLVQYLLSIRLNRNQRTKLNARRNIYSGFCRNKTGQKMEVIAQNLANVNSTGYKQG